jgi:LPXTG-motif cell wall-anchored protein
VLVIEPPTDVGSEGPEPVPPPVELPKTGSNSTNLLVSLGSLLLVGGALMLAAARRPKQI